MESVGKGFAQKLDEFIFQGLLRETEYSETLAGLGAHGIYTLAHKPLTRVITATSDDVPPVHNAWSPRKGLLNILFKS